jgi:hypothetical protein
MGESKRTCYTAIEESSVYLKYQYDVFYMNELLRYFSTNCMDMKGYLWWWIELSEPKETL